MYIFTTSALSKHKTTRSGTGRATLFAASGNARTFDYEAGDVGYVPVSTNVLIETIILFANSELLIEKLWSLR